jgi:hypothetical protein
MEYIASDFPLVFIVCAKQVVPTKLKNKDHDSKYKTCQRMKEIVQQIKFSLTFTNLEQTLFV